MVCFVVDTDGKIADAHVHPRVHPLLDAEAVRVVMKSPKWKPAKKDGKPVRVSYTMPVISISEIKSPLKKQEKA